MLTLHNAFFKGFFFGKNKSLKKRYFILTFFCLSCQINANTECLLITPIDTGKVSIKHKISGYIEADYNGFYKLPFFPDQTKSQCSVLLNGEYSTSYKNFRLIFHPFLRYDFIDHFRTHADIREFFISYVYKKLNINAGIRKYSWTNYPGFSITNFINRVDMKENPLSIERLGQPGVDVNYQHNKQLVFSFFMFPYYRDVYYSDYKSRLMFTPVLIDNENIKYESEKEQLYPELALRTRVFFKKTELTFGVFHGYNRTTDFFPNQNYTILYQNNRIIKLGSIEAQQIVKGIILRNELIGFTFNNGDFYWGIHPGVEYTFSRIFGTKAELMLNVEYIYDKQKRDYKLPFGNNYLCNFRFDFNDFNNTALQVKWIINASSYDSFIDFELSRRLPRGFKAKINSNFCVGKIDKTNPLYIYQYSTSIGAKLAWYF